MTDINKINKSSEVKQVQQADIEHTVEKKGTSKAEELFKRNLSNVKNISSGSRISRFIKSIKSTKSSKMSAKLFESGSEGASNKRNLMDTIDAVSYQHIKLSRDNPVQGIKSGEDFPSIETSKLLEPKITSEAAGEEVCFFQDFRDGDKLVVKEAAIRAHTVDIRLKGLEAKLDKTSIDDPSYQAISDEYKSCVRSTKGSTWASTNSPRLLFEKAGKVEAKKNQSKILANLRMHSVEDADGKVLSQVTRSGAISDFTHGEISLQELKDFEAFITDKNVPLLIAGANRAEFISEMRLKAIKSYGSDLLDENSLTDEVKMVLGKIDNDEKLTNVDVGVILNMKINEEKLSQVIKKRQETLETLALQDLYLHFKTNPVKEEYILYGRTSLLDMTKPQVRHKGCVIDERTQALDMKALFDGLQSRKVVFDDSKGPYIDNEGIIHMPKDCSKGVQSTTLETFYFNISVQRNTKNTGIQEKINSETIQKFEAKKDKPGINTDALTSLIIGLDKLKRSNSTDAFNVALQTIKLASSLGGYVGVNCYGGKDRTGYLLALNTDSHLPDKQKLKSKWRSDLLGEEGVASKIAYQNANHRALKLTRFDLKLYNVKTIQGIFKRVADYFSIITSMVYLGLFKASVIRSRGQLNDK